MSEENEIDEIISEIKKKENEENALSFSEESALPTENKMNETAEFELVDEPLTAESDNYEPDEEEKSEAGTKKAIANKKIIIIAAAVILVVAIAVGIFAYVKSTTKEPETTTAPPTTTTTTTAAPVIYNNPLTNEDNYNQKAGKKRPVALVVENSSPARPQWGMDDETNAPDIILEGEVEGGETRMLWFFADYTALPKQVGPMRSARPPFIKFSELFDSIFVHWGQSYSKGNYIGASTVFSKDKVDHINQMKFNDTVGLYGRDKSRNVAMEHTGVLYGSKLPAAIKQLGFRTDADKKHYTAFGFNSEDKPVGTDTCNSIGVTFSSRTATRSWIYNEEDKLYYTSDYRNNTGRKNLLVLYDETQYVVKENYKNGRSETYCDYKLSGGNGKLVSLGTSIDIKWSVENGVLVIKDTEGKSVNLNTGKTWIGWVSANNGGKDYGG